MILFKFLWYVFYVANFGDAFLGNFIGVWARLTTWLCAMDLSLWDSAILHVLLKLNLPSSFDSALCVGTPVGSKFNFQKYIKRSLGDDFKVVVSVR